MEDMVVVVVVVGKGKGREEEEEVRKGGREEGRKKECVKMK